MKEVPFYKHIGGYETYVKVRGRWYWVCRNGQSDIHLQFIKAGESAGVKLTRQGKLPTAVQTAHKRYGVNFASVERSLPQWTESVGFE